MGFAFVLGASVAVIEAILNGLPRLDQVEDYQPYQVSRLYDVNHQLIGEFYVEKRTLIAIKSLPPLVRNAFLAAEDADFYRHQGIDYFGIARAILNEVKYQFVGGQRLGGSTITQQTAKTMLLGRQRTYTRKIKEFIMAKRIEDALTKDEILNLYLNQIYFGNGAYGLEEAAMTYYGVSAKNLTLCQAASLASVPKSPNKINPIKDPERVRQRRDYVLDQMVSHKFITEAVAHKARAEPIVVHPKTHPYLNSAPYFAEEVRQFMIEKFGEEALYKQGFQIHSGIQGSIQIAANEALRWGLRVIDKRHGYRGPIARFPSEDAKQAVERIEKVRHLRVDTIVMGVVENVSAATQRASVLVANGKKGFLPLSKVLWARPYNPNGYTLPPKEISALFKVGDIIWVRVDSIKESGIELSLEQRPIVEGALVAIHPQSHRIVAMVGGYDFAASNYNRATQARRQPGSSFKPFVYTAALEDGLVTPATLINDAPKVYGSWKPKNADGKFRGKITLRQCLISSVNMCSIDLLERTGVSSVLDLAERAGEITENNSMPKDLTLALGSGEVTPLLHVNAFTLYPNAGLLAKPVLVDKIFDQRGNLLFQARVEESEVVKPATAYVMTNMMRGMMAGAGRRITGLTDALAGKTGTTNEYRSAWFLGFSQDLTAGVYVGFDDNRSLGVAEYGARTALPIWGRFMGNALKVMPAREFIQPEGIVWRLIDQQTGELAKSNQTYDPEALASVRDESESLSDDPIQHKSAILEAFIAGTEPGAVLTTD